eukprot:scaffold4312_cov149-Skeletonema_dohrnii-CCMP3373.AAC.1
MSESINYFAQLILADALFEHCKSECLSEEGLREIIERFGLSPNINPHVCDYKFFIQACINERVTEGIIQCLLEYFSGAASATDDNGWSPIHCACRNKSVTLEIVQLLIDAAPDSVRSVDNEGRKPLHYLCKISKAHEMTAIEILKLLVEKHPGAIKHADNDGFLPIHIACLSSPPGFCSILVEAYPESERIGAMHGMLPFHCACAGGTLATVQYLYKLYPDAINHTTTDGHYPIHYAILGMNRRDSVITAVDIVQFLLDCDSNVKLQKYEGTEHGQETESLLHFACDLAPPNIEARIQIIKEIYDAYPEAIEDDRIASDINEFHQQVQTFINGELVYSRQAKHLRLMTTSDDSGQLPLHIALQSNVRLGSIRLLVKGNPAAAQSPDNSGRLPLHVACEHHASPSVVQYLVGLDISTLSSVDSEGNTALHYACRGARYDTIAMFLDKYDAVSVSKRNAQKKLPIDLLWDSNEVLDRESIEYTESVFRLLKAYPETLTINIDMNMEPDVTQMRKKRKVSGYSVAGAQVQSASSSCSS